MGNRDHSRRLLGFARRMRSEMTDAEKRMWSILRKRRIAGFKFRRQVPIAGYILDFYCIGEKLAIELDGGQHIDAIAYDEKRTAKLKELGVRVLRFWDDDVLKETGVVADAVYEELLREPPP